MEPGTSEKPESPKKSIKSEKSDVDIDLISIDRNESDDDTWDKYDDMLGLYEDIKKSENCDEFNESEKSDDNLEPGTSEKPKDIELPGTSEKPKDIEVPGTSEKPKDIEVPGTSEKPKDIEVPGTSESPECSKKSIQSEPSNVGTIDAISSESDENDDDTSDKYNDMLGLDEESSFVQLAPLTHEKLSPFHKALQCYPDLQAVGEDPAGLKVTLLPHQKQGLKWMIWRETQTPCGGILADDMGLGKTLSMLALVLNQKNTMDNDKTFTPKKFRALTGRTLIVCPSSVLAQWENEIKTKISRDALDYHVFHGSKREKTANRFYIYDIVLTSYSILQRQPDNGPLHSAIWERVILDEAHTIRNHKTRTAVSVFKLNRKFSWAITGTPIHNKGMDYYSLMKFIDCRPFSDLIYWKKWMNNKDEISIQRLNVLNKTIMLRRTKAELNKPGSSLKLKSKMHSVIRIEMAPEENTMYIKLAALSRAVLAKYIQQKAEKENLLSKGIAPQQIKPYLLSMNQDYFKSHPDIAGLHTNLLNIISDIIQPHEILMLILRLRQMCCHASLITSILDKEEIANEGIDSPTPIADHMVTAAIYEDNPPFSFSLTNPIFCKSKISSKVRFIVECVEQIFDEGDDKIIIVSQWTSFLSIIEGFLDNRFLPYLSFTGKVPVKDRESIVDRFNNEVSAPRILLLSLTAGGTGLNLMGGNHLLLADIHWNPQLEAQACDRIYRYGQEKDVHVYKFICTDTIEEKIEQLQKRKLEIAKDVLTGSMTVQTKLTLADFKHLFGVKSNEELGTR